MARVAPSDAAGARAAVSARRELASDREWNSCIRTGLTLILSFCVLDFGQREMRDLLIRSTATARAVHDPTCWVHIYPYDEDDAEVAFEVAYRVAEEDAKASEDENMFSMDSNRALDVQFGNINHLISDECTLLIMRGEGGAVFRRAAPSTIPTNSTESVHFSSCRAKPGGGDIVFEEIDFDDNDILIFGGFALGVFLFLRLFYAIREMACHGFEIIHPITTTRPDEGCGVPRPLRVLLEKFTGGGRLLLRNVYLVILRPYITYGIMSSSLLDVFSSIHLNDDCPQLVMQTGHHMVAVAAVALGIMVTLWCFHLFLCHCRTIREIKHSTLHPQHPQRIMHPRNAFHGREYPTRLAEVSTDAVCIMVLVYWVTSAVVNFPVSFVVELRFLFSFSWPSYALSRWAHLLRISAFLLRLLDTVCACLKFRAANSSVEEAMKKKAQGCSAMELKEAGFSAVQLVEAGFSVSELNEASFSVVDLKEAIQQLKRVSFSAVPLKEAGFSAADLNEAGFSAADLKEAGFSASELKEAGFSTSELKEASFSAWNLKEAGVSAVELEEIGFSAVQLKDASFSASELKEASFAINQLKEAGFSAEELNKAGFSAEDLEKDGLHLPGEPELLS